MEFRDRGNDGAESFLELTPEVLEMLRRLPSGFQGLLQQPSPDMLNLVLQQFSCTVAPGAVSEEYMRARRAHHTLGDSGDADASAAATVTLPDMSSLSSSTRGALSALFSDYLERVPGMAASSIRGSAAGGPLVPRWASGGRAPVTLTSVAVLVAELAQGRRVTVSIPRTVAAELDTAMPGWQAVARQLVQRFSTPAGGLPSALQGAATGRASGALALTDGHAGAPPPSPLVGPFFHRILASDIDTIRAAQALVMGTLAAAHPDAEETLDAILADACSDEPVLWRICSERFAVQQNAMRKNEARRQARDALAAFDRNPAVILEDRQAEFRADLVAKQDEAVARNEAAQAALAAFDRRLGADVDHVHLIMEPVPEAHEISIILTEEHDQAFRDHLVALAPSHIRLLLRIWLSSETTEQIPDVSIMSWFGRCACGFYADDHNLEQFLLACMTTQFSSPGLTRRSALEARFVEYLVAQTRALEGLFETALPVHGKTLKTLWTFLQDELQEAVLSLVGRAQWVDLLPFGPDICRTDSIPVAVAHCFSELWGYFENFMDPGVANPADSLIVFLCRYMQQLAEIPEAGAEAEPAADVASAAAARAGGSGDVSPAKSRFVARVLEKPGVKASILRVLRLHSSPVFGELLAASLEHSNTEAVIPLWEMAAPDGSMQIDPVVASLGALCPLSFQPYVEISVGASEFKAEAEEEEVEEEAAAADGGSRAAAAVSDAEELAAATDADPALLASAGGCVSGSDDSAEATEYVYWSEGSVAEAFGSKALPVTEPEAWQIPEGLEGYDRSRFIREFKAPEVGFNAFSVSVIDFATADASAAARAAELFGVESGSSPQYLQFVIFQKLEKLDLPHRASLTWELLKATAPTTTSTPRGRHRLAALISLIGEKMHINSTSPGVIFSACLREQTGEQAQAEYIFRYMMSLWNTLLTNRQYFGFSSDQQALEYLLAILGQVPTETDYEYEFKGEDSSEYEMALSALTAIERDLVEAFRYEAVKAFTETHHKDFSAETEPYDQLCHAMNMEDAGGLLRGGNTGMQRALHRAVYNVRPIIPHICRYWREICCPETDERGMSQLSVAGAYLDILLHACREEGREWHPLEIARFRASARLKAGRKHGLAPFTRSTNTELMRLIAQFERMLDLMPYDTMEGVQRILGVYREVVIALETKSPGQSSYDILREHTKSLVKEEFAELEYCAQELAHILLLHEGKQDFGRHEALRAVNKIAEEFDLALNKLEVAKAIAIKLFLGKNQTLVKARSAVGQAQSVQGGEAPSEPGADLQNFNSDAGMIGGAERMTSAPLIERVRFYHMQMARFFSEVTDEGERSWYMARTTAFMQGIALSLSMINKSFSDCVRLTRAEGSVGDASPEGQATDRARNDNPASSDYFTVVRPRAAHGVLYLDMDASFRSFGVPEILLKFRLDCKVHISYKHQGMAWVLDRYEVTGPDARLYQWILQHSQDASNQINLLTAPKGVFTSLQVGRGVLGRFPMSQALREYSVWQEDSDLALSHSKGFSLADMMASELRFILLGYPMDEGGDASRYEESIKGFLMRQKRAFADVVVDVMRADSLLSAWLSVEDVVDCFWSMNFQAGFGDEYTRVSRTLHCLDVRPEESSAQFIWTADNLDHLLFFGVEQKLMVRGFFGTDHQWGRVLAACKAHVEHEYETLQSSALADQIAALEAAKDKILSDLPLYVAYRLSIIMVRAYQRLHVGDRSNEAEYVGKTPLGPVARGRTFNPQVLSQYLWLSMRRFLPRFRSAATHEVSEDHAAWVSFFSTEGTPAPGFFNAKRARSFLREVQDRMAHRRHTRDDAPLDYGAVFAPPPVDPMQTPIRSDWASGAAHMSARVSTRLSAASAGGAAVTPVRSVAARAGLDPKITEIRQQVAFALLDQAIALIDGVSGEEGVLHSSIMSAYVQSCSEEHYLGQLDRLLCEYLSTIDLETNSSGYPIIDEFLDILRAGTVDGRSFDADKFDLSKALAFVLAYWLSPEEEAGELPRKGPRAIYQWCNQLMDDFAMCAQRLLAYRILKRVFSSYTHQAQQLAALYRDELGQELIAVTVLSEEILGLTLGRDPGAAASMASAGAGERASPLTLGPITSTTWLDRQWLEQQSRLLNHDARELSRLFQVRVPGMDFSLSPTSMRYLVPVLVELPPHCSSSLLTALQVARGGSSASSVGGRSLVIDVFDAAIALKPMITLEMIMPLVRFLASLVENKHDSEVDGRFMHVLASLLDETLGPWHDRLMCGLNLWSSVCGDPDDPLAYFSGNGSTYSVGGAPMRRSLAQTLLRLKDLAPGDSRGVMAGLVPDVRAVTTTHRLTERRFKDTVFARFTGPYAVQAIARILIGQTSAVHLGQLEVLAAQILSQFVQKQRSSLRFVISTLEITPFALALIHKLAVESRSNRGLHEHLDYLRQLLFNAFSERGGRVEVDSRGEVHVLVNASRAPGYNVEKLALAMDFYQREQISADAFADVLGEIHARALALAQEIYPEELNGVTLALHDLFLLHTFPSRTPDKLRQLFVIRGLSPEASLVSHFLQERLCGQEKLKTALIRLVRGGAGYSDTDTVEQALNCLCQIVNARIAHPGDASERRILLWKTLVGDFVLERLQRMGLTAAAGADIIAVLPGDTPTLETGLLPVIRRLKISSSPVMQIVLDALVMVLQPRAAASAFVSASAGMSVLGGADPEERVEQSQQRMVGALFGLSVSATKDEIKAIIMPGGSEQHITLPNWQYFWLLTALAVRSGREDLVLQNLSVFRRGLLPTRHSIGEERVSHSWHELALRAGVPVHRRHLPAAALCIATMPSLRAGANAHTIRLINALFGDLMVLPSRPVPLLWRDSSWSPLAPLRTPESSLSAAAPAAAPLSPDGGLGDESSTSDHRITAARRVTFEGEEDDDPSPHG